MSEEAVIKEIHDSHALTDNSPEMEEIRKIREDIETHLSNEFKDSKFKFRYAGSKAKDTMIKASYDGDLTIYFHSEEEKAGKTLKDIYESVAKALEKKYLIERKTSAIRILNLETKKYTHVDIVPGRYFEGESGDTYLYLNGGEKDWLKTNLDVHIAHIKDSGHRDMVRVAKLWKVRNNLSIKTFVLELLVIKILDEVDKDEELSFKAETFFKKTLEKIDNLRIEDPANPNGNDLSKSFDVSIRTTLKSYAQHAVNQMNRYGNELAWEKIFGPPRVADTKKAGVLVTEELAARPQQRPWSNW